MADADTTLNQIFTGDPSKLLAAYKSVVSENVRLEQQTKKLAEQSKRAADQTVEGHARAERAISSQATSLGRLDGMMRSQLGSLAQMVTGYLSLQGAMQLVTHEMQTQQRLRQESLDFSQTIAQEQAKTALALGQDVAGQARMMGALNRIQQDTGYGNLAKLIESYRGASSAAMGDEALAGAAVRSAARATTVVPGETPALAASIVDAAVKSGTKDTDSLAALLFSGTGFARPEDPQQAYRQFAKGMASIVAASKGDPMLAAEQAVELQAGMSSLLRDVNATASTTSGSRLFDQVEKLFREGVETGSGRAKRTLRPGVDPGLPLDRLRVLQQDPALREAFLGQATFEAGVGPVIRRILEDPNSPEARTIFQGATSAISADPAIYNRVREAATAGTPQLRLESERARAEADNQQQLLREEQEASNATRREILKKALDRSYRASTLPGENALYMTDFDLINTGWGGSIERTFGQGDEAISGARAVRERADAMLSRAGGDRRFMTTDDRGLFDYLRRTETRLRDRYRQEQGVGEEVEDWGPGTGFPQSGAGGAGGGRAVGVLESIDASLKDIAKTNARMATGASQPGIGANPAANAQRGVRNER